MFLCLGPVRSAASAPRREESADLQHRGQLRRRPDDTDGWRHREGYTGDSTPHIRSDTSIAEPPLSVCPLYQQSLDRRREGGGGGEGKKKIQERRFFRCRIAVPAPSKNRGLRRQRLGWGGERRFEPSDNASNHGVSPPYHHHRHSCFQSVCSRESELCQSWWEPITYAARPSSQSNRQTEDRVTAVSRVWRSLSALCHIRLVVSCAAVCLARGEKWN